MSEQKIDPELVNDLDEPFQEDVPDVDLPEYDPLQFELPEDYEYVEDDEDASDA